MTAKKLCKNLGYSCDYIEWGEDDELYCTDPKTPLICEVPKKPCKYPDIWCPHTNYYLNDEEEENPLCEAIREGVTECPFQVYEPDGITWPFQETLLKSPYWNLKGFQYFKDRVLVDEKVIVAIQNWAADCTEPTMPNYKDTESMFNALDLIYKLLEELQKGPLTIENKDLHNFGVEVVELNQITSINNGGERT